MARTRLALAADEPVLARTLADAFASNPFNEAFYERHGFEVVDRLSAAGSPPLALMWRDPQPLQAGGP